jgi:hypothetical protein
MTDEELAKYNKLILRIEALQKLNVELYNKTKSLKAELDKKSALVFDFWTNWSE